MLYVVKKYTYHIYLQGMECKYAPGYVTFHFPSLNITQKRSVQLRTLFFTSLTQLCHCYQIRAFGLQIPHATHNCTARGLQGLLQCCCVSYQGHKAFSCPRGPVMLRVPESSSAAGENRVQHAVIALSYSTETLTYKVNTEHK